MGDGVWTLAIVACGPQLEVALGGSRQRAASLVRLAGVSPRSTLVLAAADLLIEDAGASPGDIVRVVVSRGPGSFTGIRAGIATAQGLAAANHAELMAFDSLLVQAARCRSADEVWSAQPGRRGEVYARCHRVERDAPPSSNGEILVLPVVELGDRGPWVAAESLDLGDATRAEAALSAAEALLALAGAGTPSEPVEPLYIEGPPIHGSARS
jgi:tRNA threonylcarbamoyl adenosine modification protein YeaZ